MYIQLSCNEMYHMDWIDSSIYRIYRGISIDKKNYFNARCDKIKVEAAPPTRTPDAMKNSDH